MFEYEQPILLIEAKLKKNKSIEKPSKNLVVYVIERLREPIYELAHINLHQKNSKIKYLEKHTTTYFIIHYFTQFKQYNHNHT